MQLLQIHEPGETPTPEEQEHAVAIGIDLGTTHSLVATSEQEKPTILTVDGQELLPSMVAYQEAGDIVVGEQARELLHEKESKVVVSVKRLMGKDARDIRQVSGTMAFDMSQVAEDQEGLVKLQLGEQKVTPIEVSAEILKHLKSQAEKSLGKEVTKAVITVPAYFDDAARLATKDAGRLAGLDVLRLVNEPTAAALAYGLDSGAEGIYAVYDLGGGTFDISLLKLEKGVFRVLATSGNALLGGDDFDHEIVEFCLWHIQKEKKSPITLSTHELKRFLQKAKEIKEYLTDHAQGEFEVEVAGEKYTIPLSRERFEEVIGKYVTQTIFTCEQVIEDAKISKEDIQGVILVGGSTRVPLVQKEVETFFGKKIYGEVNPDQVVALGAALQAEALTRGSNTLLLDVLPLSLGIETMGGLYERMVHRNTSIPTAKSQEFTTYKDGQTGLVINVLQGEREMAVQNRSLAQFELKGIPPMKAGIARVEVTFTVDADGLLTVSAKELTTGETQHVEVKPSYGLTESEIQQMLRASLEHGRDDMELRLFTEKKVEAEQLVDLVETALVESGDLLTADEKGAITDKVTALKDALQGEDREAISVCNSHLEEASGTLALKRVNKELQTALKGQSIEQVEEELEE